MSNDFSDGLLMKGKGNQLFVSNDYKEAIPYYEDAIALFDKSDHPDASNEMSKVYANMAECHLRLQKYATAEKAATLAISNDAHNVKAYFRRGRARLELSDLRGAIKDFTASNSNEGRKLEQKAMSKLQMYGRIIDSYRLRMEDEYTLADQVDIGNLSYSEEVTDPSKHFRGYMRLGLSRSAFPQGFSADDFDSILTFAKDDEWYNIKCTVHLADVKNYYGTILEKPREFVKLRELAVKVVGPILSSDDEGDESLYIGGYMSDESYSEVDLQWMYEPPYSPYQPLIDSNDREFGEKVASFMILYKSDFPIQYLRLNIDWAFRDHVYQGIRYTDFYSILLRGDFGHNANGLKPAQFSAMLQKVMHSHHSLLGEMVPKKFESAEPVKGPSDWHFDHYGTLCALILVAYDLLSEDERGSADIQERLAHVLLSGEEDILTGFYRIFDYGSSSDEEEWKEISTPGQWNGPNEYWSDLRDIPDSWNEGVGTELMFKAFEVWQSIATARKELDSIQIHQSDLSSNDIIDKTNGLLQLSCFSKQAISSLGRGFGAAPWDANCGVLSKYYKTLELTARALLDTDQVDKASELLKESAKWHQCSYIQHNCFKELVKLRLVEMEILIASKHYRKTKTLLREVERYIRHEERNRSNPSLLENELIELKNLAASVTMKCGPAPKRTPNLSENGWYTFDASVDEDVRNAVRENEYPTIELWLDGNANQYPHIAKLHLDIAERIGLEGLHGLFPNLTHLVVDDSKECCRCCYNTDELRKFASSLEYLELNLSSQWMAEGDDVIEPIASLINLRELRIHRRRDGAPYELKHLERLEKLERIFYWGCNRLELQPNLDPWPVLDLTQLKALTSVVFIEASFCHESERNSQVLILPRQVMQVACIDIYGSETSKHLIEELEERGLDLYYKEIKQNSEYEGIWKEVDNLYGGWYHTTEQARR